MKEVTIYGLIDPMTYEVRYVGQTGMALKRRLQCHLAAAHRKKEVVHFWIESLRPLTPALVALETVWEDRLVRSKYQRAPSSGGTQPVRLASVMEAKWLKRFRRTVLNASKTQCKAYDDFVNPPELVERYGVQASQPPSAND